MKGWNRSKPFSAVIAAAIVLTGMPAFHADAVQSVSLNIEKIAILDSSLNEDGTVAVSMRIQGNEEGFLAAEFGVAYDHRLTLESVSQENAPGNLFNCVDNPDNDFIWFSGASANKESSSCEGRQELLTMYFKLPDSYSAGDVFYIGYSWDALDGKSAYWYSDKGVDQIDWVRGHSIAGSISISDPTAPRLEKTELKLNQGDTDTVKLSNFDGTPIWYSDHNDIAEVDNDGVITAHAPGTCTVYCYAGTSLLTCDVTVTEEYYYSIIGVSPIVLTSPANKVYIEYPNPQGMIIWMSTRTDIVDVIDGQIFGISNGSAQIISTSNGVTYARQVVVNFPEVSTEEPTTEAPTEESVQGTEVAPVTDASHAYSPDTKYGDINGDGNIDMLDVVVLTKNLFIGTKLDESAIKAADVCLDGVINETDCLTLLKHVVEIIPDLPMIPK